MGTDLCTHVERRRSVNRWERAEPLVPNPFLTDTEWMKAVRRIPGWEARNPEVVRETIYDERNSDLYNALVFGVKAGDQYLVEPVARPRGLPEDMADETRAKAKEADGNSFGHSWLRISEIEAYDWDQEIIKTASRCMAVEPGGEPKGWSTVGIPPGGSDWEPVGDLRTSHYGAIIQTFARPAGQTYREACQYFLGDPMSKLRSYGPLDDLRIVVWFD